MPLVRFSPIMLAKKGFHMFLNKQVIISAWGQIRENNSHPSLPRNMIQSANRYNVCRTRSASARSVAAFWPVKLSRAQAANYLQPLDYRNLVGFSNEEE